MSPGHRRGKVKPTVRRTSSVSKTVQRDHQGLPFIMPLFLTQGGIVKQRTQPVANNHAFFGKSHARSQARAWRCLAFTACVRYHERPPIVTANRNRGTACSISRSHGLRRDLASDEPGAPLVAGQTAAAAVQIMPSAAGRPSSSAVLVCASAMCYAAMHTAHHFASGCLLRRKA